jgi:hypothetical protein
MARFPYFSDFLMCLYGREPHPRPVHWKFISSLFLLLYDIPYVLTSFQFQNIYMLK